MVKKVSVIFKRLISTQPVDSIFTTNQIIDIIYIMYITLEESSCSCDFRRQKGKSKDGRRKAGVRKYGTHTHMGREDIKNS